MITFLKKFWNQTLHFIYLFDRHVCVPATFQEKTLHFPKRIVSVESGSNQNTNNTKLRKSYSSKNNISNKDECEGENWCLYGP